MQQSNATNQCKQTTANKPMQTYPNMHAKPVGRAEAMPRGPREEPMPAGGRADLAVREI